MSQRISLRPLHNPFVFERSTLKGGSLQTRQGLTSTSAMRAPEEGSGMNLRQMTLVDCSRQAQLLQSAANPTPDKTEAARFLEGICGQGDCLHLRPQQRVPRPAGKVLFLREGMLAIDATPAKGK